MISYKYLIGIEIHRGLYHVQLVNESNNSIKQDFLVWNFDHQIVNNLPNLTF